MSLCIPFSLCGLCTISTLSFQGLCEQTVNVLQLMEAEGIEPNLVMLNLLINAFGTAGRHLEALAVLQHIKDSVCSFSRNERRKVFFLMFLFWVPWFNLVWAISTYCWFHFFRVWTQMLWLTQHLWRLSWEQRNLKRHVHYFSTP